MTLSRQAPDSDLPDIRVPLDAACFIIAKSREFDVETASSDLDAPPLDGDDIDAAVLVGRSSDPAEAELKFFIPVLSDGAQTDLDAIMWMGRGDGPDSWAEAKHLASSQHDDRAAEHLVGQPLLPDRLEEGLAAIDRSRGEHEDNSI